MNKLVNRVRDALTPSVGTLVRAITALEGQVEKTIAKGVRQLDNLAATRSAVDAAIKNVNSEVDAAYKLLNKVSGLVR